MSASLTLASGASLCHLPRLGLEGGGALVGGVLGYDRVGDPAAPAVLVLGGISAGCRSGDCGRGGEPGWWEPQVGANRPLDPARLQILGIDYLGGRGASSTLAGRQVSTDDQAAAIESLLDALGITRLHAVVGASYGGQVAQKLAVRERVGRLITLCAPFSATPLARAWRSIQQQIVALGAAAGREVEGVALARQLAMTTYRSAADLAARFPRWDPRAAAALGDWLASRGHAFACAFDGAEFCALSSSIDRHVQDPAEIPVPTTVVGIAQDQLVPIEELREDAARLPRGSFVVRSSRYGHDGFLKETAAIRAVLRDALTADVPLEVRS